MFGFGFLELYVLVNLIYTVVMFLLFHGYCANKIAEKSYEIHKKELTKQEISIIMFIFYFSYIFVGTVCLIIDFLQSIFTPKNALWLHWLFKEKEKEKDKSES
jgi:hypothetical protein